MLATALILTMAGESFAVVNAADANPAGGDELAYVGYEWERIRSYTDLRNFYVSDKDNASYRYNVMDNFGTGTGDNNENHWFRALIVYSDYWDKSGKHVGYFMSGIDTCQDGESYKGRFSNPNYGLQLDADTFVTNSGLNTPYIKYCNNDPDNNCPRFYLRFSGNDKLGSTMASLNISWYGIAYHAAAYGEWGFPPSSNPGQSHDHNWAACSSSSLYETSFRFAPDIRKHFEYYCKNDANALKAVQGMTEKQLYGLVEAWNFVDESQFWGWYKGEMTGYHAMQIVKKLYQNESVSHSDMEDLVDAIPGKSDKFFDFSFLVQGDSFSFEPYRDACAKFGGESGKDIEGYETADREDVTLGYFEAFYNVKGVADRHWCHPDNDYEIEMCKFTDSSESFSGRDGQFMLFLGRPHAVPVVIVNSEIVIGSTRVYDDNVIKEGITVRIPKGATLQIRGTVFNNGRILVDGGTLIVSGQIDTTISVASKYNGINPLPPLVEVDASEPGATLLDGKYVKHIGPGLIEVRNGGMVVVEETGAIIQRNRYANFTVDGYSSVNIEGAVVTPATFSVTDSTLRAYPGSLVATNFWPDDAIAPTTFGRANIAAYKSSYLTDFGNHGDNGGFTLSGGSACLYGLFYSTNATKSNSGYMYCPWQATNIDAQISSMMSQW